MKKRLLLIRHAESEGNKQHIVQGWLDLPLSERGHEQAELLGRWLAAHFEIAKIFTSPLCRATETANYLSKALNKPLIYHETLKERNLGALAGLNREQIKTQFPNVDMAWLNNLPRPHIEGAENNAEFATRAEQALTNILNETESETTVAVFTHGGLLNRLLQNFLTPANGKHISFVFNNASLSIVDVYSESIKLVLLNSTTHLGKITHA